jgi:NDP-sugar pyrophosphorylase family protein
MDELPVCILAGGLSRRLRPVTETIPKAMVPIGGKPFVQLLLEHFSTLGYRRFVLAVSYLWEHIHEFFGDGRRFGWQIDYSIEPEPLDTGGAVLWAQPQWGQRAIIANGDTFLPEDWRQLQVTHDRAGLPATMALAHQNDCARFGRVDVRDGRVVGFVEKSPCVGAGWINAGVYVLEKEVLSGFRRGQRFSLELDVFPAWVGQIAAHSCHGAFADIGTPESLEDFRQEHLVGR